MREPDEVTKYRGPDIPTPLGRQLQRVLDVDERPRTFGAWVEAVAFIVDRDDVGVDLDILCTTDESPHQATFNGETQHYQCPQDAFIVPFLADDIDTVEIETECPVSGEKVCLTVTESTVTVEPSEVVISFGVAANVDEPSTDAPSPILAYAQICPYGNAFVSRDEYEEWAADTDALTMAISVEDTLELARALGDIAT